MSPDSREPRKIPKDEILKRYDLTPNDLKQMEQCFIVRPIAERKGQRVEKYIPESQLWRIEEAKRRKEKNPNLGWKKISYNFPKNKLHLDMIQGDEENNE